MLYVLLILVVALALVSGAEYAMLRVAKAEHKVEVAKLKEENRNFADRFTYLLNRNKELSSRLEKLSSIEEGLNK